MIQEIFHIILLLGVGAIGVGCIIIGLLEVFSD